MSSSERNLFLMPQGRGQISKQEAEKLAEKPHSELLAEAFNALCRELDTNGNTPRFQELREEHSKKLNLYWQSKLAVFSQATREGRLQNGELVRGDERISVETSEYDLDGEKVGFNIKRRTATEEDEITTAFSQETGVVDESVRMPTIKSEIRTDPDEPADIVYEVKFQKGDIFRFKRTIFRARPERNYPIIIIEDSRTIECFSSAND